MRKMKKKEDKLHRRNIIMMNDQKDESGEGEGFNIFQSTQDRTNLEGQLEHARNQITKHTEWFTRYY